MLFPSAVFERLDIRCFATSTCEATQFGKSYKTSLRASIPLAKIDNEIQSCLRIFLGGKELYVRRDPSRFQPITELSPVYI